MKYVLKYGENPFNISRVKLSEGINKVMREMGVTSHAFRRSKITEIAKEEGLLVANQFIGHKSLETTRGYIMGALMKSQVKRVGEGAQSIEEGSTIDRRGEE